RLHLAGRDQTVLASAARDHGYRLWRRRAASSSWRTRRRRFSREAGRLRFPEAATAAPANGLQLRRLSDFTLPSMKASREPVPENYGENGDHWISVRLLRRCTLTQQSPRLGIQ